MSLSPIRTSKGPLPSPPLPRPSLLCSHTTPCIGFMPATATAKTRAGSKIIHAVMAMDFRDARWKRRAIDRLFTEIR